MKTRVTKTPLAGLAVVTIDHFEDERGFFLESWNKRDFAEAGLDFEFVQDSHSRSSRGVIRGLHYQNMQAPMTKLIRCTLGRIFDVAVDLRVRSATFGNWFGIELGADNKKQLLVPVGFAHGFACVSDVCEVQYKQTAFYRPDTEAGISWNDPDIAIEWPIQEPILSKRDQNGMSLQQYRRDHAFE